MNPLDWFVAGFAIWKIIKFRKLKSVCMTAARCPVKTANVALISRHHFDAIRVIFYKFRVKDSRFPASSKRGLKSPPPSPASHARFGERGQNCSASNAGQLPLRASQFSLKRHSSIA
jgi:hypothetical protein